MASFKERWGIKSNLQLTIIFFVFAITGSTSAWITKPIMEFLGITKENFHVIPYWILRILLILPVYKVILICVGTLFGQHRFFWNFVKKMLFRMKLGFLYGKQKKDNE